MSAHKEPTDAALLATAVAVARTGRRAIEETDRTSFKDVGETLDALHEHLAVAGGSLLILAERMGWEAEVKQLLAEGQARIDAFRACAIMEGRA